MSKRKFFSWLLLCFVVFAFGTGGCGGSDNDSGGGGVNWTTLSGTWTPTSGSLRFYSTSGGTPVTFNLDTSSTADVDVAITASDNSYYNFEVGDGEITFRSNTSYNNLRTYSFWYEDVTPPSFQASGRTLTNRNAAAGNNQSVTTTIKYVSSSIVDVTVTRRDTANNLTTSEARVRLQRPGTETDDEDADDNYDDEDDE